MPVTSGATLLALPCRHVVINTLNTCLPDAHPPPSTGDVKSPPRTACGGSGSWCRPGAQAWLWEGTSLGPRGAGSQLCFWDRWGSDSLYGHSRSGSHGIEGWGIPTEADGLTPVLRVVGAAEGLGSRSGLCPTRLGPKRWDSGCRECFWRVTV